MHYHCEIIMPPTDDVDGAVAQIMETFSENNESPSHAFWDWFQLGGRYSGAKLEALATQEKLDAFRAELNRLGVTVSGLVWGKQELQPASQAAAVDELWRAMCPGAGDTCPMLKHSGDHMALDVCKLSELPPELTTYTLIVAGPDYRGEKVEAHTLLHKRIWNGVTYQDTTFDGKVASGIAQYTEQVKRYREGYADKMAMKPDWLVVTVDYHS